MSGPNAKVHKTLEILDKSGVVPPYTAFDITEEMIAEFVRVYGTLSEKDNQIRKKLRRFDYGMVRFWT